jgi:hypothetical protein
MLVYLAAADNFSTMRRYLRDWGQPLRQRLAILAYESRPEPRRLPDATYLFADVDRLTPASAPVARAIWDEMQSRGERVRCLNSPRHSLERRALLERLHRDGLNRFAVHGADADPATIRFPVFLRSSHQHKGAFGGLLADAAALHRAIEAKAAEGWPREDLLVVEHVDVGQDGLYRKYSAMRVGPRLIAHHIMFERQWEVKGPSLAEPAMLAEERAFQESNPHHEELMRVYRIAGIDYGRIDYGLLDGRVQVWEINPNPTLLYPRARYRPEQLPAKHAFTERLNAALLALDDRSPPFAPGLRGRWQRWRLGR